jgi:hypothetical protein
MIKKPVCLVRRSVKTGSNMEALNFWIHGCKSTRKFRISNVQFRIWLLKRGSNATIIKNKFFYDSLINENILFYRFIIDIFYNE